MPSKTDHIEDQLACQLGYSNTWIVRELAKLTTIGNYSMVTKKTCLQL